MPYSDDGAVEFPRELVKFPHEPCRVVGAVQIDIDNQFGGGMERPGNRAAELVPYTVK